MNRSKAGRIERCRYLLPNGFLHNSAKRIALILPLLVVACSQRPAEYRPDRHAQIFESTVLDSLLATAPQTVIDLDGLSVEEWTPDMELGHPRDSLILGGSFFFALAKDSIYFGNLWEAIYAADMRGTLHRKIGRRGKGPGEFDQLNDLGYNGRYFFTEESSRIQVLDGDFKYVATLPPTTALSMPGAGMAITKNQVYVSCGLGLAYRICPFSGQAPFDEGMPFLPSLDIDWASMNGVAFGATPDGRHVIVAFVGLPYLFVFNANHEHEHTLRLAGEPIENHAHNYTIGQAGVPGTGLRILILSIHVLDDEYLAVPLKDVWHFIRLVGDGSFEHAGAIRLLRSDTTDTKAVFATSDARLHGDNLYVYANNTPHLLRYAFQL